MKNVSSSKSKMIKQLVLSKFTAIKKASFVFAPGINVFVGGNATGKTHVMKLIYSLIKGWSRFERVNSHSKSKQVFSSSLVALKLAGVFQPDLGEIGRLVWRSRGRSKADIKLVIDSGVLNVELGNHGELSTIAEGAFVTPACIFLPAREVLSIYPGFTSAYEERELAFDETYYDLCVSLGALPLRGPRGEVASTLWRPLSEHLHASVKLEGQRFYLTTREGKIEAHLAAEGFRKIASLMHLIANGSLMKNGVLFWDEPEANLNPKLVKVIADFLIQLAHEGIQIFVATHDYLLTNELSLQSEYRSEATSDVPIRFFSFHRHADEGVSVGSGATLAELDNNPIQEEFEAFYDRERKLFHKD